MTSLSKSRAWALAAELLIECLPEGVDNPLSELTYIRTNVIPSLRRRAAIIKRGAKGRKR